MSRGRVRMSRGRVMRRALAHNLRKLHPAIVAKAIERQVERLQAAARVQQELLLGWESVGEARI